MKFSILFLAAVVVLCGCASSTPQKRARERAASYAGMPPETKTMVDHGKIKTGMTTEAVYIAWGQPSEILNAQTPNGVTTTTWLYYATALQENSYWSRRRLQHDYYPQGYVAAEVIFENGVVKAWRNMPRPP